MQTICVKHICKEWNFLNTKKILRINGAILDKNQLKEHLEIIASNHNLKNKTDKQTYPDRVYSGTAFIWTYPRT